MYVYPDEKLSCLCKFYYTRALEEEIRLQYNRSSPPGRFNLEKHPVFFRLDIQHIDFFRNIRRIVPMSIYLWGRGGDNGRLGFLAYY